MKKTGVYFFISGIIISAVFTFLIVGVNDKIAWYYFGLIAGLVLTFLGISFLFYEQALEKRRKVARTMLIAGLSLCVLVYTAGKLHWQGANIAAVLTGCFLSFTYLPLLTKNRVEKWKRFTRKIWHAYLLSLGDLISLASLVLGLLFRIMHWPGAAFMMTIGFIILAASLVGWNQLFSKEIVLRKQAEDKVNESFAELKKQHEIIEEKNKEILDSIHYAKRIQNSLMPTEKYIKTRLDSLLQKK